MTQYVWFLDNFIDSSDDVEVLVESRVSLTNSINVLPVALSLSLSLSLSQLCEHSKRVCSCFGLVNVFNHLIKLDPS